MNPIGNVPVFLALTNGEDSGHRRQIASRSLAVATGIIVVFAVLGQVIFSLFGITINAFRVAGGALLFVIAFHLLQGQTSRIHHPAGADDTPDNDLAVAPLGTPILAGPGTIATTMSLSATHPVWAHTLLTLTAFLVVVAATAVLFRYSDWVARHFGQTEISVITRMMGLLLTVVAVQMIASGVIGLFPLLGTVLKA